MNKIKKTITVYVPGNVCNFRCSYCYIADCLKGGQQEYAHFSYSVEHMVAAFRPERIGGIAYIVVIGIGETLIPAEVVPFVKGLLHQGHVVEVVTNNTLNNRIDELLDMPREDLSRLIVKCSLHWLELKRLKKVDDYFSNIKKVIAAGASAYPFMVICEEYMEYWQEICEKCEEEIGALPECTPCVVGERRVGILKGDTKTTKPECTSEFVRQVQDTFHSRLFEESVRFLSIDQTKTFCYAGKWSFGVGMGTGDMVKCHNLSADYNFYEDIDKKIELDYAGYDCGLSTCSLQYQLYGLGVLPEINHVPTYSEMICERRGLFTKEVADLMDTKISDEEPILTEKEKIDLLLKQISEKDEFADKCMLMIKKQKRELSEREEQKSVQNTLKEVLTKMEENQFTYRDCLSITYEHLKTLYEICREMENEEQGRKVFETIYKEMLDSVAGVGCIYDDEMEAVAVGVRKMPITAMAVREEDYEEVTRALQAGDYVKLADIYYTEVQRL